jgi:hypothetical protein
MYFGRRMTPAAFDHLGLSVPTESASDEQKMLFD